MSLSSYGNINHVIVNSPAFADAVGEEKKGEIKVNDSTFLNIPSLLFGFIRFIAWLISWFVSLIAWSISPDYISGLMNNDGVYAGWTMVRDVLNMFFIFFLLYSAFCTIFQISRYHIKSTWVMIIVMALLVNFSWPITRIIVDTSNIMMAAIIDYGDSNGVDGNSLMSKIGSQSNFAGLLIGQNTADNTVDLNGSSYPPLFMGILTGFLFLVTIGAVALILVIRGIALAVLLIFASAGFALAAFPSTRSYASQWWSSLIKYAFTGPILVFMLLLSVMILDAAGQSGFTSGIPNTGNDPKLVKLIATLSQYTVSLVVLWTAIIVAGKLGDGASSAVLSGAAKARAWGKKTAIGGMKGGMKFTGRGLNYGSALLGNKLASNKNQGIFGKIGRGVGTGLNVARSVPQRAKNKIQDGKDSYNSAIEESRARGLEFGGGKVGGEKNAMKNIEAKKVAARMKELESNATTVIGDGLEKAEGAELAASIKTLVKRDDVSDKEMGQLIKELHRLDDDLRKVAMKKITESGKVDASVIEAMAKVERKKNSNLSLADARRLATNNIIKGMDNQTIARNGEMLRMGAMGDNDVKVALQNRVVNLKVRQQIQSEMKNKDDFNNFNAIVT